MLHMQKHRAQNSTAMKKVKREEISIIQFGSKIIFLERNCVWLMCSTLVLVCCFHFFHFNTGSGSGLRMPWHGKIVNVVQDMFTSRYFQNAFGNQMTHPRHKDWRNLLVETSSNYKGTLAKTIHENVTIASACYNVTTSYTTLEGLPKSVQGQYVLKTDMLHYLTLISLDANGNKRCAGGDYYEVDLHDRENVHYRSRPPTVDFGNGSYGLELIVPSQFAGTFSLDIWLLFTNWHGMDLNNTDKWVRETVVLTQELELVVDCGSQKHSELCVQDVAVDSTIRKQPRGEIRQCTQADFNYTTWQGRWTRTWFNNSCVPDSEKRFQCLPEEHYRCEEPWCFGPVGRLESNGWAYSAHCSFKIFQREEAWKCLDGRWFLWWGDSNFQDTIRNLLLFVLDWNLPPGERLSHFQLNRTQELEIVNPHQGDQLFRISQVFNGANRVEENWEGLNTIKHKEHQERLLSHFQGARWPDTIVLNSGLHDSYNTVESYSESADFVIDWWAKLYNSIQADRRPQVIWRSTIAPAGFSRKMGANPNKMEMFNQVMVEKLQDVRDQLPMNFVDAFDLSFPFHYDNEFSDGGHYGRAPGVDLWPWHRSPHWYFVDLMFVHILLNAVCPLTTS